MALDCSAGHYFDFFIHRCIIFVRELVGWVRNVVLMNVYLDLENPGGSGFGVRGHMGQVREVGSQFTSNPGKRWTDPVTARRVPSK